MIPFKKKFTVLISISALSICLFAESLPHGYKEIKLGMSLEETKETLVKNPEFGYHGDRDVSLIPHSSKTLIETDAERGMGSDFLTRCWFQFSFDELYIITINVNPEKMDYYSIFKKLTEKYGEPTSFNPQSATWKDDEVTMSLEKPLTLKYIDNKIFDQTQNYSNIQASPTEITQEMFLDEL